MLDSFSVESKASKAAQKTRRKQSGAMASRHMARDADGAHFSSSIELAGSPGQCCGCSRKQATTVLVVLGLYLFDEVMPKSVEGEMAAKRADAIAAEEGADFVNTGTSRVRV